MKNINLILALALFLFSCISCSSGKEKAKQKNNEIVYTTVSGNIVQTDELKYDALLVENVYEDGIGYLRFSKDIEKIGSEAFRDKTDLLTINIPSTVKTIGKAAFGGCSNLTEVNFANNAQLETIEDWAFAATPLKSFYVPLSVTKIGTGILAGCDSLFEIDGKWTSNDNRQLFYRGTGLVAIAPAGLKELYIDEAAETILEYACLGCSGLETIYLPSTIRAVNTNAFWECPNLKAIYFSSRIPPLLSNDGFRFTDDNYPIIYTPKSYTGHLDWGPWTKGHVKIY